jgi:hypothetical protein
LSILGAIVCLAHRLLGTLGLVLLFGQAEDAEGDMPIGQRCQFDGIITIAWNG